MRRSLPNQLTVLRLILAGVFFLVLNQYRYGSGPNWALWVAIVVFIVAALSDIADGYLARRWKAETTFGRIMDPFCDKVLILGAFIYLSGPRFVIPEQAAEFFNMATGVYPWMVVLMLARELLVTDIRGALEGTGIHFGANVFGKLKMILQSVTIPVVLAIVYCMPDHNPQFAWMPWVRDSFVYTTVLATLLSGLPYISRSIGLIRDQKI